MNRIFLLLLLLAAFFGGGSAFASEGQQVVPFTQVGPVAKATCPICHGWRKSNPEVRQLNRPHNDKSAILKHGPLWCLDCHDANGPNKLNVRGSKEIAFDSMQELCGTCHQRQIAAYKFGAHGKRVGSWQGERRYMRCSGCHNPHAPAIPAFKPSPVQHNLHVKSKTE